MTIADSPSMTVKEAIEMLRTCPPDNKLKIWLPGSHIWLVNSKFPTMPQHPHITFIEGNLEKGSALDDL